MLPSVQTELSQTRAQRTAVLGDILRLKELLLVSQSCRTLCNSTDCSPPGSSVHGISQARILEWILPLKFPPSGRLPNPGIEPTSPAWQADSLPLSHLGSPKVKRGLWPKKCKRHGLQGASRGGPYAHESLWEAPG